MLIPLLEGPDFAIPGFGFMVEWRHYYKLSVMLIGAAYDGYGLPKA